MSPTTVDADPSGPRTAPTPPPRSRRSPAWGARWRRLLPYLASSLLASAGAAWALRLWTSRLDVPITYWGDAVAVAAHVRTTLMTGWYEQQPLLGWPHGQQFHDFPTSDDLHLAIVRVMGLVVHDWATVLNLYYLLGFPLAALTATYFLRRVGTGPVATVVAATLFALAPYHFVRGEAHLYLASYWVVPPVLLLVVRAFRGEPLWRRPSADDVTDRDPRPWYRPDARAVGTALACLLLGTASAYYAVFSLLLLAVAGVAAFAHRRDWRRLLGAAAAGGVLLVSTVAMMVPDVLHARAQGENVGALGRFAEQAEIYALKITSLLLPTPGHVVPQLAALRDLYDGTYPLPSERPALGAVGALGLVALLVVVVVHLARPGGRPWAAGSRWSMLVTLGATTLVALLLSTVGGVGSLISFVTPNIRGWNRMSILVAMLALAGFALLLDELVERAGRRLPHLVATSATVALGAVVVVVGTLDQVSPGLRPDPRAVAAEFDADAAWVADVEASFGADAAVFQLPYMAFPESPARNWVFDADQLKGFLHSDTLRWSGGGIKGRATSDWPARTAELPTPDAARALAAAGFDAVLVDLRALGTADAPRVAAEWREVTGEPAVVGADGRFEVFDLRDVADALDRELPAEQVAAAGEAVTEPVTIYLSPGAESVVDAAGRPVWTGPDGVDVVVDNAADEPRRITVRFSAVDQDLRVTGPGVDRVVAAGATTALTYDAEPGQHTLTVRGTGTPQVTITAPTVEPDVTPLDLLTAP